MQMHPDHLVVRRPHEFCPIHVRYLASFIMLRSSGGNHKVLEEEAEKLWELEEGEESCEILSLGHGVAIAPMLLLLSDCHTEDGYVYENYSLFNWLLTFFW